MPQIKTSVDFSNRERIQRAVEMAKDLVSLPLERDGVYLYGPQTGRTYGEIVEGWDGKLYLLMALED